MKGIIRTKINQVCLLSGILLLVAVGCFSQDIAKASKDCQPKVRMASLLDAIKIDGTLKIGEFYVECLTLGNSGSVRKVFEPYQGTKFITELKDSRGRTVNSFAWYGVQYFPEVVKLTNYEIVGGVEALKEITPGDYTLEFAIGNKVFQKFPFSVRTKKSDDVYRPGTIYLLEGGWRDEAILFAPTVENVMCFSFRLRADYELAEMKPVNVPFELKMFRDKDRQLVAKRSGGLLIMESNWKSYRECFSRPSNETAAEYSSLKLKEILAADGSYTISLSYGGKPYATYKFDVRNGKINGEEMPARNIRVILRANILRR